MNIEQKFTVTFLMFLVFASGGGFAILADQADSAMKSLTIFCIGATISIFGVIKFGDWIFNNKE